MVFVLTNTGDATADFLCGKIENSGLTYLRLDTDSLTESISISCGPDSSSLISTRGNLNPDDVSAIWMRRPEPLRIKGVHDAAEESHVRGEWAEAIEGFLAQVPIKRWINHPARNVKGSHKIEQLIRASRFGLAVPDWIVTSKRSDALGFFDKHCGEVIAKPLASGYLQREVAADDTLIYTNRISRSLLENFPESGACPTLFQKQVDKTIDIRVTIVDRETHAVGLSATDELGKQRLDIRRNNMEDVSYSQMSLSNNTREMVVRYVDSYGLRFSAIDMVQDSNGNSFFLENNPNGQWAWLDLAGISNIADSFLRAFRKEETG